MAVGQNNPENLETNQNQVTKEVGLAPKEVGPATNEIANTISDFDIEFFGKLGIPKEAIQEMREFIPYFEYGEMINKLKRLQDNGHDAKFLYQNSIEPYILKMYTTFVEKRHRLPEYWTNKILDSNYGFYQRQIDTIYKTFMYHFEETGLKKEETIHILRKILKIYERESTTEMKNLFDKLGENNGLELGELTTKMKKLFDRLGESNDLDSINKIYNNVETIHSYSERILDLQQWINDIEKTRPKQSKGYGLSFHYYLNNIDLISAWLNTIEQTKEKNNEVYMTKKEKFKELKGKMERKIDEILTIKGPSIEITDKEGDILLSLYENKNYIINDIDRIENEKIHKTLFKTVIEESKKHGYIDVDLNKFKFLNDNDYLKLFTSTYGNKIGRQANTIPSEEDIVSLLNHIKSHYRNEIQTMMSDNFITIIKHTSYRKKYINLIYKILESRKDRTFILKNYVGHFDTIINEDDLFNKLYEEKKYYLIIEYLTLFKVEDEVKRKKIENCYSLTKDYRHEIDIINQYK